MSGNRKSVLLALIRENGWTRGAELGVWEGDLFRFLLASQPDLHMTGVDNWKGGGAGEKNKETGNAPYTGKDMVAAEARARMAAALHPARAVIVKGDTAQSATLFADGTFDFVFIDASHDTDSVKADIAAWRSKVCAGGALTGHDTDWPSVTRALDEMLPGWQPLDGNVWIFRV